MKYVSSLKVPWDMAVFLGITFAGFGLSVKELAYPNMASLEADNSAMSAEINREPLSVAISQDRYLDLGCLERRGVQGRLLSEFSEPRVRARFCGLNRRELSQIHSIHLRNLTTGTEESLTMVGDLLVSSKHRFQQGKNVLQLEWREKGDPSLKMVRTDIFEK